MDVVARMDTANNLQLWLVIGQFLLVIVGLFYSIVTLLMWKKLTAQVKSTSSYNLAALSNEHNWRLLTFHDNEVPNLPIAVPSWKCLTAEQWRWRVLHLNHLNLIKLAWYDLQIGVLTQNEIEDWIDKARYIFQGMRSNAPEFSIGREQLRQLLFREEGTPDAFRNWLITNEIISDNLLPDQLRSR